MEAMDFPSVQWVEAWVQRANDDAEFVAVSQGFSGAVGAVIRSDAAWTDGPLHLRLEGADGCWVRHQVGSGADLVDGTLFTLTGDYLVWKRVVAQELDPIRGIIQGRLRVRGQLSSVLRWARAFRRMTTLASEIPTTFADKRTGR